MQHVDIWVPFRSLSDIKQRPKKIKSNLIRNVDITINGGEPMCFGRDLYVATLQQRLYMEYISLSWSDIPVLVVPISSSFISVAATNEDTEPRVTQLISSLSISYTMHLKVNQQKVALIFGMFILNDPLKYCKFTVKLDVC
jgi:hypothetical protein